MLFVDLFNTRGIERKLYAVFAIASFFNTPQGKISQKWKNKALYLEEKLVRINEEWGKHWS